jgi:hypothetical protein
LDPSTSLSIVGSNSAILMQRRSLACLHLRTDVSRTIREQSPASYLSDVQLGLAYDAI